MAQWSELPLRGSAYTVLYSPLPHSRSHSEDRAYIIPLAVPTKLQLLHWTVCNGLWERDT